MINRGACATLDGGAGKTALAFAFALDLNFYLISNDDSIIADVYEGAMITDAPQIADEVIYDFGGFADGGVIDIIKSCDVLVVPCINDKTSIRKANQTIEELSTYIDNIFVVATRVKNERDLATIKEGMIQDVDVLPMRDTKMFKDCQEFGVGAYTLIKKDKKLRYAYRNAIVEYDAILGRMIGYENLSFYKNTIVGDA